MPSQPLPLVDAPPCQSCAGGCCARYSIEVTVFDIERLSSTLGLDPAEFCDTLDSWPGRCAIEPSLVAGRLVNVVLRQVDRACLFLVGGPHGCSVYASRPRSCVVYPFMGSSTGVLAQRPDRPCPAPWSVSRHAPGTASELARLNEEIAHHNALVRQLNDSPHASLSEHLDALRATHAATVRLPRFD